ncbi:hypothetical protein SAMN04489806_1829 [Paramicrobacterium humi]|uniref:FtsX-like permease family protein n=1 Tax=Paramicrobacterium humi TaxID=640635 RepID=A0A1H4ME82_9MICO|nr:hypothetical protein [Microbacterium humi]SEB80845.1 hypothetical protein SAMN04489806_1829 [Microbacterium humi]
MIALPLRRRRGPILTLALVALVVSAALTGLAGILSVTTTQQLREVLAHSEPDAGTMLVKTRVTDDPGAQRLAAAEHFRRLPVGITVTETVRSPPLPTAESVVDSVIVGPDDGQLRIVDGTKPDAASSVAQGILRADAAERLGLGAGDALTIAGVAVMLTGTWEPADPNAPEWFGDPSGAAGDVVGPLLVDPAQLADFGVAPFAQWVLTPDRGTITPSALGVLAHDLAVLPDALEHDPAVSERGIVTTGHLPDTLADLAETVASVETLFPVAVLLIVIASLIVLSQFTRLVASLRAAEFTLLRARGASLPQLVGSALAEAGAVNVVAAAIGAGIGALVVPGVAAWIPLLVTVAVTVLSGILHAAATFAVARRALGRTTAEGTGRRSRSILATGAVVVLVAFAAVSVYRLRSEAAPGPFSALAPTLTVLLLCVLALAVIGPIVGAAERLSSRRLRGALLPFALRHVSRGMPLYASVVVTLLLAGSLAALASAYSGTTAERRDVASAAAVGTDVRVHTPFAGQVSARDAKPAAPADVRAAASVLSEPLVIGESTVPMIAIGSALLPDVMSPVGGAADRSGIASALGSPDDGIPLPGGALILDVRITAAHAADVTVRAWTRGADGAFQVTGAAVAPTRAGKSQTATLELGDAGGALVGVDVIIVNPGAEPLSVSATVEAVRSGGQSLQLPAAWQSFVFGDADIGNPPAGDAPGFAAAIAPTLLGATMRLTPLHADARPVPAVLDAGTARRLGVATGDALVARIEGSGRTVTLAVAGTTPVVPGAPDGGLIVDLAQLNERFFTTSDALPRPNERWLASPRPDSTARALTAASAGSDSVRARTSADASAIALPASLALWGGAIGAAALAVLAVVAASLSISRARRSEPLILRGLGLPRPALRGIRSLELLVVIAVALVLGVGCGVAVSLLTIDVLAAGVVPGVPAAVGLGVGFSVLPLAGLLAATAAVALVCSLLVAGTGTRRAAGPRDTRS